MMKVPTNLPYSSVQASKLQKQRDLARERDTHTQAKGLQIDGRQLQAANMKIKMWRKKSHHMVICDQQGQKYTQQHSASDWIYALLQKKKTYAQC